MYNEYEKRRVSYWVPIAIVIVLISLIVVYTSSQEQQNVYQGEETTAPTKETVADIPLETYSLDQINLSYGIPEGWTKVIKDGILTYIHSASTSSFQLEVKDYNPELLTISADYAMAKLNSNGMSLINFQWSDNTTFVVLYSKGMDDSSATYYVDTVTFDQEHYVHTAYSFPGKYYERIMPTITAMIDAVKWKKEKPYPTNMTMIYNSGAKAEFAVPTSWKSSAKDNVLYAQDPQSGMTVSYIVNESKVTYGNITQLDYMKWASSGRANFALQTFECSVNKLDAVATYFTNNQKMVLVQRMIATGTYEYIISFEMPQSIYQNQQETISSLLALVKTYPNTTAKE